jgi:flavin reductase (DIM6/NTAB) family NADH-FMN oxidoreductase RutF
MTHRNGPTGEHQCIWPSILYFGTPIALVTTMNADQTPNIGPMSSAWALGYTVVMGWESTAHTLANLERERECVINLPGPALVEEVEALAPLTGRNPPAPHKADTFRFEPRKFQAAGLTPTASTSESSRPMSSEFTRSRASSSLEPTTSIPAAGTHCSTCLGATSPPAKNSHVASAPKTDHEFWHRSLRQTGWLNGTFGP